MTITPNLMTTLDKLPTAYREAVIAIGNFDGVHRGHQAVIAQARHLADNLDRPLIAMVFDPHPVRYFNPDAAPFRLTRIAKRAELLSCFGVDGTIALPFTQDLAQMSADQFIAEILCNALKARGVTIGHDFHFGAKRSGSPQKLAEAGEALGFETIIVEPACRENAQTPFSSSEIREALAAGELARANQWLGRAWSIDGPVAHGDARGRLIGFPTANIALEDFTRPAFGVYAIKAVIHTGPDSGKTLSGVANIGLRPTVGTVEPRLEAHLFDYAGDLYGHWLEVQLMNYMRGEQKFDSLEVLTQQIGLDSQRAREILATI